MTELIAKLDTTFLKMFLKFYFSSKVIYDNFVV